MVQDLGWERWQCEASVVPSVLLATTQVLPGCLAMPAALVDPAVVATPTPNQDSRPSTPRRRSRASGGGGSEGPAAPAMGSAADPRPVEAPVQGQKPTQSRSGLGPGHSPLGNAVLQAAARVSAGASHTLRWQLLSAFLYDNSRHKHSCSFRIIDDSTGQSVLCAVTISAKPSGTKRGAQGFKLAKGKGYVALDLLEAQPVEHFSVDITFEVGTVCRGPISHDFAEMPNRRTCVLEDGQEEGQEEWDFRSAVVAKCLTINVVVDEHHRVEDEKDDDDDDDEDKVWGSNSSKQTHSGWADQACDAKPPKATHCSGAIGM